MHHKLDSVIRASFEEFADKVREKWVYGKEREAVSIFAMDHLLPRALSAGVISQNSQIAIESRVPQLKTAGKRQKSEVCKDLVIWSEPYQNCWQKSKESGNYPLAIIEWKANIADLYKPDVDWLQKYTRDTPTKIGYVVTVDFMNKEFIINSVKIHNGDVSPLLKIS